MSLALWLIHDDLGDTLDGAFDALDTDGVTAPAERSAPGPALPAAQPAEGEAWGRIRVRWSGR